MSFKSKILQTALINYICHILYPSYISKHSSLTFHSTELRCRLSTILLPPNKYTKHSVSTLLLHVLFFQQAELIQWEEHFLKWLGWLGAANEDHHHTPYCIKREGTRLLVTPTRYATVNRTKNLANRETYRSLHCASATWNTGALKKCRNGNFWEHGLAIWYLSLYIIIAIITLAVSKVYSNCIVLFSSNNMGQWLKEVDLQRVVNFKFKWIPAGVWWLFCIKHSRNYISKGSHSE